MSPSRRRPILRVCACALVIWLAADALSHGTCAHDLIAFARAARSQVGDTSLPHPRTSDRDDVNHCSCHWQYLPAASGLGVEFHVLAPVVPPPAAAIPPLIERTFERPPQRCA